MDPFADKVMVLTALLSMAIGSSAIPPVVPWVAVIILLMKELAMIIGGLVMLKHGIVVYSRLIGKTAHCVFIAGLVATYFHDWFVARCVGWMLTPDLLLLWLGVWHHAVRAGVLRERCDPQSKGKGNHLTAGGPSGDGRLPVPAFLPGRMVCLPGKEDPAALLSNP